MCAIKGVRGKGETVLLSNLLLTYCICGAREITNHYIAMDGLFQEYDFNIVYQQLYEFL